MNFINSQSCKSRPKECYPQPKMQKRKCFNFYFHSFVSRANSFKLRWYSTLSDLSHRNCKIQSLPNKINLHFFRNLIFSFTFQKRFPILKNLFKVHVYKDWESRDWNVIFSIECFVFSSKGHNKHFLFHFHKHVKYSTRDLYVYQEHLNH